MFMDIVGSVPEARQRLDLVDYSMLPSDVHVPHLQLCLILSSLVLKLDITWSR